MSGNVVIKMSVQRIVCTGCGSEANASCNCGLPYKPKAARAREMREADPTRSLGSIAEELGMARQSVRDALQVAGDLPPAEVIGRDGKKYPVRPRLVKGDAETFDPETGEVRDSDAEHEQGLHVIAARGFLNRAIEAKSICTIEKLHASDVTEAMVEAAYDAAAAWGEAARNLREMLSHG
jgi:hypothetical protein